VTASASQTNTSRVNPFVSSGTRFEACERNVTDLPSAEITALALSWLPSVMRVVVPVARSHTNTNPFVSSATRFEAVESNATPAVGREGGHAA
jgi:hypothetical protein